MTNPSTSPSGSERTSASRAMAPTAAGAVAKPGLLERYLALAPMYRWAVAGALVLVLWLFASDYVWPLADDINQQSDRIQRALEEGAARDRMIERDASVRSAVTAIGQIAIPRAEKDGTQELAASIDEVMRSNRVTGYSLDVRAGARLPPNVLAEIAGPGGRIEKVVGELKFDATQEVAARIIAELESRPEIESISRLKLTKRSESERKVTVQLTVEAWIQVDRGGRRGA